MVFGLYRCYVASWDADPCLLRAAAEGSPEETELVAFDRLNTMRSTVRYVYGQCMVRMLGRSVCLAVVG